MRGEDRHADGGARDAQLRQVQDLARLDDDLPLLLGVAVVAEDVDMGQRVEGDGVRVDRGLERLAGGVGLDLRLQLHHGLVAGAAHGLVGVDDDALDADAVAQGREQRHQLHRRAVGVGHDAFVSLGVRVVDARDDERDAGLHAPLRRVVDDDGAARCRLRREDLRGAASGREERDVDALEGLRRGDLDGPAATLEDDAASVAA